MIGLLCFVLAVLTSPFKSKLRLEAENAVLRHQLIVLPRRAWGPAHPTNNDPWFVVPTIGFRMLYGFVIVRLDRRDLVWINVTTNPTAEWIARQITEAFLWDGAPGYMIRDRDRIYGAVVTRRLRAMGIRDKPIAPVSPWHNGFAERLIGSIRHECLDHIIVLGEEHLRRILKNYAAYYNGVRTHRSLQKDAPISRPVQRTGLPMFARYLGWASSSIRSDLVFGTHN